MAKIYNDFNAKRVFEGPKTKKDGMTYYSEGQTFTIPEDYEKCLGYEIIQGTKVPCLILEEGGTLFLSSITKRVYLYECDGSDNIEKSYAGGNFVCTGFVEDSEGDVFEVVASCANQLQAVERLAGKTIEIYKVDEFISAGGDFIDANGRVKFVPTKLVKKQLPRFRFVK